MSFDASSHLDGYLCFVVVLTALAAATQWAAAILSFHPALGPPWAEVLGRKLYAPWKLFAWWIAFEHHAPMVFARAGALAALGGSVAGLIALGGAAWRTDRKDHPATYGSARWARDGDMRQAGLRGGNGIVLGVHRGRYLRHDADPLGQGCRPGRTDPADGQARRPSTTSRARTGSSWLCFPTSS